MACDGIFDLNPLCLPITAARAGAGATTAVTTGAFGAIANFFAQAATGATSWLWEQIGDATSLDLRSPALATEMAATGAIAAVLCVALFVIQLITATLRGHPVQLGRAVSGLLVSFLGSAFALATTRLLLGAVDALSDGVVTYTLGTTIDGLSAKFALTQLSGIQNPAVIILFAIVILAAVVVVWGAMMVRKLMLIVAAVLAPIAFAGATADFARGWVRKWIEFVAAMIASKLLLVIILSLGVAVVNGAGQSGTGTGQTVTQLAAGSLILLLGGFAPWMAIRMFHFAGDSLYAAHTVARSSTAGAQSAIAAPQKVVLLHSQARSLARRGGGGRPGGWSGPGGSPGGGASGGGVPMSSPPPSRAGTVASSRGAAAATSAAVPALGIAAGAATGLKAAVNTTAQATEAARGPGGPSGWSPPSGSPQQPPTNPTDPGSQS